MKRTYERVPRDEYGFPLYRREPQVEAVDDELDGLEGFESPDSSETVDFTPDESPAYLLGKLEALKSVYASDMPGGCRSSVRKAIAILQKLVGSKTESVRRDFESGAIEQLRESAKPERYSLDESRRYGSDLIGMPPMPRCGY